MTEVKRLQETSIKEELKNWAKGLQIEVKDYEDPDYIKVNNPMFQGGKEVKHFMGAREIRGLDVFDFAGRIVEHEDESYFSLVYSLIDQFSTHSRFGRVDQKQFEQAMIYRCAQKGLISKNSFSKKVVEAIICTWIKEKDEETVSFVTGKKYHQIESVLCFNLPDSVEGLLLKRKVEESLDLCEMVFDAYKKTKGHNEPFLSDGKPNELHSTIPLMVLASTFMKKGGLQAMKGFCELVQKSFGNQGLRDLENSIHRSQEINEVIFRTNVQEAEKKYKENNAFFKSMLVVSIGATKKAFPGEEVEKREGDVVNNKTGKEI